MNVVGNRSVYRIKCRVDGSIEQFVGKSIDNKKNSMVLQTDNACQKKIIRWNIPTELFRRGLAVASATILFQLSGIY
jgi:hypothetical protein